MRATRRSVCAGIVAAPFTALRAAPVRTDTGYTQDWFHDGFLNLREDAQEAAAVGQRLAVVFEQRGCPYCVEMHTNHLAAARVCC